MIYEFRVSEMAEEFGVHRNTIRNWIAAGTLPAKEGPGRKYIMKLHDYQILCRKFGREPHVGLNNNADPARIRKAEPLADTPPPLQLAGLHSRIAVDPEWGDACIDCGTCASACPLSGVDGLDPRKLVRMAVLGMDRELVESDWPWKCTMCGKCEVACPASVQIVALIRRIRASRDRELVPGPIHGGVVKCLERGNNLGIPKSDFLALCQHISDELAGDGWPGLTAPIDRHGARVLVTINSKLPFAEPDEMKHWWKIFHAAGESWTLPSENWEGVNWGMFSGDDAAMKVVVGRIVDNMRRLNCEVLLLPECGHAYLATRTGLARWFPEVFNEFKVVSIFDLLLDYLRSGRIQVDPGRHPMPTTYHDSCNYGRKSLQALGVAYFDEGREIARACCPDLREMAPNREDAYCCGAGGGAWAMPFNDERVFYGRFKARQISESGAHLVLTSCHNCRDQIRQSLDREYDLGVEVKCLWQLVADSLVVPGRQRERG